MKSWTTCGKEKEEERELLILFPTAVQRAPQLEARLPKESEQEELVPKKEVSVKIVDDNQWEPDEEFFVKLTLVPGEESENVRLGRTSIMEITILNDDGNDYLLVVFAGHPV